MSGEILTLSREEAADLLGWWLDAGVDSAISEQPRDWLKANAAPARSAAMLSAARVTAAMVVAPIPDALPDTLQAFEAWLASAAGLPLDEAGAKRILPHGPAEAEVMLISECPAREDATDDRPIGGTAWQLMVRMLASVRIEAASAYSASLACFHLPAGRLDPAALDRCADLMRHHIALVKPKRILLLGDAPSRALIGQPLTAARGRAHKIDGVRAVVTFHPRFLLARPADKALAWRDLLLMTDEEPG